MSRRTSGRIKAMPPAPPPPAPTGSSSASPAETSAKPGGRSLRPRRSDVGMYEVPSESDDEPSPSNSQEDDYENSQGRDYDEDSEMVDSQEPDDEEEEEPEELPERGTGTSKTLRPRKSLTTPKNLSDYVNVNTALGQRRKKSNRKIRKVQRSSGRLPPGRACQACRDARRRCDRNKPKCTGCQRTGKTCIVPDDNGVLPENELSDFEDEGMSKRAEVRKLTLETERKQKAFLIQYRHLFEPLLPERNYVAKLAERQQLDLKLLSAKDEPQDVPPANGEAAVPAEANGVKPETNGEVKDEMEVDKVEEVIKPEVRPGRKEKPKEPEILPEVVPYTLLEKQPEGVTATMKPYQLSGLSFLVWLYKNGAAGILGDEMGLGKTLQTLSLFSHLTTYEPCPKNHHRPFLVVCPLSVLSSWVAECKRWTPHLRVLRFHGPTDERNRMKKVAESGEVFGADDKDNEGKLYDVVVTTYEVFEKEKNWFRRAFVWRYVVLDEGHKIKNDKTNIATALQGLKAEFRLILTGTPLQNNLTELWALFHWLYPEVFQENTVGLFTNAFDLTQGKNDLKVMDSARGLLELIMLRRMKESQGVNLGLPKKTEMVMFLPLTPMQRFWYKRLLTRLDKGMLADVFKAAKDKVEVEEIADKDEPNGEHHVVNDNELEDLNEDQWGDTKMLVEQAVADSKTDQKWRKLMNLLMQLRKCCDHPYLLPGAEPDPNSETAHSQVILASSKCIFLDKLVEELCMKQGKKVLIFSGFTRMLDVVEDLMHLKGGDGDRFRYGRLDGTTPRARRNLAIRLFNTNPDYKVMLISTRAGGLGINLASASDVVMLESDWNPQADLQAQARAHRIGQTQPVTVYRLVTQGTVEEQMMGRIRKKLYLSAKVTESMRDIHTSTSSIGLAEGAEQDLPTLNTGQLMSLVRSGARAIARPEVDPAEMLKMDWSHMLEACKEYQEKLESLDNKESDAVDDEEKRWLSEMERVETRVFEGVHHQKTSGTDSNRTIASDWAREERRAGMNRVVMIDGHPVLKETIGNAEWEAVKTLSGSDPTLKEPEKRKRRKITHQDYCQVCFDGGTLHTCSGCPRTYHLDCLAEPHRTRMGLTTRGGKTARITTGQWYCPQHQCRQCEQKTTNAGGCLFRCRWCENAFCEDCIEWEKTELLGESLTELELLEFGAVEQAFWIKCEMCTEFHERDAGAKELCGVMEDEWREEAEKKRAAEAEEEEEARLERERRRQQLEREREDEPALAMEGTTVSGSEVATPYSAEESSVVIGSGLGGFAAVKAPRHAKASNVGTAINGAVMGVLKDTTKKRKRGRPAKNAVHEEEDAGELEFKRMPLPPSMKRRKQAPKTPVTPQMPIPMPMPMPPQEMGPQENGEVAPAAPDAAPAAAAGGSESGRIEVVELD